MKHAINNIMIEALDDVYPCAALSIKQHGQTVFEQAYGWLDPDTKNHPASLDTRFDIASLTKLFTATVFARLVQKGLVRFDTPVAEVLLEYKGTRPILTDVDQITNFLINNFDLADQPNTPRADTSRVTFRHLLSHNSGIPSSLPLYLQTTKDQARAMALNSYFCYQPGQQMVYSDIGLIVLGFAIETLTGLSVSRAIRSYISEPLGLNNTDFQTIGDVLNKDGVAPTELCQWRKRRILGEVHDENAYRLGGASGHAGLFSTAPEIATFGTTFLTNTLLSKMIINEMTTQQSSDGVTRRGLAFLLGSKNNNGSFELLGEGSFGHTGFTGTSLCVYPSRDLSVALMTNYVYYGRDRDKIDRFRTKIHQAIGQLF